mmetsp:Transcript_2159/g.5036  ORF Transcript_2159/g.5036 Transcript_2159/m.5036 type:complete len:254 (-) Transcript_2159:248-1009(-)
MDIVPECTVTNKSGRSCASKDATNAGSFSDRGVGPDQVSVPLWPVFFQWSGKLRLRSTPEGAARRQYSWFRTTRSCDPGFAFTIAVISQDLETAALFCSFSANSSRKWRPLSGLTSSRACSPNRKNAFSFVFAPLVDVGWDAGGWGEGVATVALVEVVAPEKRFILARSASSRPRNSCVAWPPPAPPATALPAFGTTAPMRTMSMFVAGSFCSCTCPGYFSWSCCNSLVRLADERYSVTPSAPGPDDVVADLC